MQAITCLTSHGSAGALPDRRSSRWLSWVPMAALALTLGAAHAAGTLRVAMTASDIPLPNGQTDQGAEGMRFMGYTVFEALVGYDLSSSDKASTLIPALATEWKVDPANKLRWVFKLRPGVKFHDGSAFDAQSVVWNLDKILNQKAEHFDTRQAAQGRGRVPTVASYKALDDLTVEIVTSEVNALLPFQMVWIVMSSPAQWQTAGKSWDAFLKSPSGTGPFKLESYVPRERAVLARNPGYWNKLRVPKLDKLVLLPVPDASARVAALRSGQVDWIEAPPPDALDSLKGAGFSLVSNVYPHVWPWHFSRLEGSPWNDIRVRKAANLAIDREGMKQLLGGMMVSAKGMVPPNSPWFGKPAFEVKYDVAAARDLMTQAGYSKSKPLKVKSIISPAGSGQMQPQLMNELIQQNLAEIGIQVEFDVRDWNALLANWRAGAKDPSSKGASTTNSSYYSQDPFTALIRHVDSGLFPPKGTNWGYYSDPEMDKLFDGVRTEFDTKAQLVLIQKAHEKYVNDALFLFVAHDVAPRAMSAKVKGFVPAQNWFLDFSTISID
ncbi:MAG: ABC transporter substrate-binding protein [Rhodoferax sp.]|jgi:peptide/nickel transport system substrate-binding protein|uniref:ABC transporter substrate-binding protein n=1 Tax=Rhodoferax sp. TaxID=50421 RepID=UPI001B6FFF41|nr:ABC transporter substrate-binding protein [Rhodoferax sp.]MBP9147541.1 ABC transporter substrate-binding protein [Rhodoferax sp.]MBP9735309.1 ABC transporter substrate-binding protein [Rhodoferax sp.]